METETSLKHETPPAAKPLLGAVRFHSSEAHKVDNEFRKHFGVSFQPFFLGFIFCKPEILIHLQKFDDYLIEKYNYEGSMSDFVLTKFGQSAHEFLIKLI